jgi:hypothetical protein
MGVIVKATPNAKFRPEKVAYYKEQVMLLTAVRACVLTGEKVCLCTGTTI